MFEDPITPADGAPLSLDGSVASNARDLQRTKLFVAATIVIDGQVDPVRVRDMSPRGALIEGAVLPLAGASLELVRAHLRVSARSMWVRGNQCGVSFEETVDVAEWMTRNSPTQQQRIDALFHRARCNVETTRSERHYSSAGEIEHEDGDLLGGIDLLASMQEALVLDPYIQMHHPDQLRSLQKVLRLLRGLLTQPGATSED